MQSKKPISAEQQELTISPVSAEIADVYILGDSPLIIHSMSWKAKQELLLPGRKKNRSERETTLKHNPIEEFQECFYEAPDDAPSLIVLPGSAFKGAVKSAALRMPGATKTEISQLLQIMDEWVPIFGTPMLHMAVVRNSGMNKTPDVRSRPILPRWCASLRVRFMTPQLSLQTVGRLFDGAGQIMGVGDFRPEKGAGNFGRFTIVQRGDAKWNAIAKSGAAHNQKKAMAHPDCYDREARRLLAWFETEATRRDMRAPAKKKG